MPGPVENLKIYFKKVLGVINEFSKAAEHRSICKNYLYFYRLTINLEMESFTIIYNSMKAGHF